MYYQVVGQKTIFSLKVIVTLTFDPCTPKSIRVIYLPRPIHMYSLLAMGSWIVKLSVKNNFRIEGHCDLDPDPLNP